MIITLENFSSMILYKNQIIDIRSGDIILFRNEFVWSRPITWLCAAIRLFTGVEYNHGGVVVSSWGVLMLNEFLQYGGITRTLNKCLQRKKVRILVLRPVKEINESVFCRRANTALGNKYDYPSLILHQLLYRLTGIWIGRTKEQAEKAMVCTEYAAWCYRLDNWWLYSAKEFLSNQQFKIHYKE
jgi:hypothetical protein